MPLIDRPYEWHVTATSGPKSRIGHTLTSSTDESKVYLYGGIAADTSADYLYLGDFLEYSSKTKEWKNIELRGSVQTSRAFHSAVWWNDRVVIFGGCNTSGRFNKLFVIFPDGKSQVPIIPSNAEIPVTRYCHSAVVYLNCMYIYGGKSGGRSIDHRLSDLYCCNLHYLLEPAAPHWTLCEQNGEKPEPRSAHSAVVHRDNMIVLGGRNAAAECCSGVYAYHFGTTMWRKFSTSCSPLRRARNSCVAYNGYVIVFGGWDGKQKLNDLVVLHGDTGTVEQMHQYSPSCRECHVAAVCKDTMVVFGGRHRGEPLIETLELKLQFENTVDCILEYAQKRKGLAFAEEDVKDLPLRLQQAILQT